MYVHLSLFLFIPLLQTFATVIVTVTDVNDNTPLFGALSYRGTVAENAPAGTTVELVSTHSIAVDVVRFDVKYSNTSN